LRIDTEYWDPREVDNPNNMPPDAINDTAETTEDTLVIIPVLDNDPDDLDGGTLRVLSVTQPSHGIATINPDNSITYTPSANFTSLDPDSFTYTLSDGQGGRDTATVSVLVQAVNDPPLASPQSVTTRMETPVGITLQATDPDDSLSYSWSDPAHGALSGIAPNLTYTPDDDYIGPDSFTFEVSNAGGSSSATVSITVIPATVVLASDGFESGNYSGGTGWRTSWTRSGDVSIRTNTDGPQQGSRHVRLRARNDLLRRSVNLTGVTNAQLTFWAKVRSFESSDSARVRVSANGSSFTTVMTFTSAHSDNTYRFYTIPLPSAMMTANFAIAFDAEMSASNDEWFVDNIQVTGVR
jgi:hypothetical protein